MPSIDIYKANKEDLILDGVKVFVIEDSSSYSWNGFVDSDQYLITRDKVEWYKSKNEYESFKMKISEKIENLL